MEEKLNLNPSYKETIEGIAGFIIKKKGSLFKRVAILSWPFFILFFAFPVFVFFNNGETIDSDTPMPFLALVIAFIVFWGGFSVIYIYFMRMLFYIEKLIWIDSFFDKEALSDKESFKISRDIFIFVIKTKLKLFFNYYLAIFVFYFGSLALMIFIMVKFEISSLAYIFLIQLIFVGPITIWIYYYYLDIKLRYFWFIYLDQYGSEDFSYKKIKEEMHKLNEISRGESYKKILVMNFGISSVNEISHGIIRLLTARFKRMGGFRGAAGQSTEFFLEEYSNQVADIGKIFTKYLLYRHARAELYKDQQVINHKLYSLKHKN